MIKLLFTIVLLLTGAQLAQAQFVETRKNVDAGRPTVIYSFFDCRADIIHAVSGIAYHGSISTRQVTQNRCGNRTQRAIIAEYTPHPGYYGPDEAFIYWGGGAQARMRLNVR